MSYLNKVPTSFTYLGKLAVTALGYYVTTELTLRYITFGGVFNHEDYTVVWPASGVALGFVLIWGRSMWPGIFIGSVFRVLHAQWFLAGDPAFGDAILIIIIFSLGRTLEPLAGQFILKRAGTHTDPFKGIKSILYFIVVALVVATISASGGSLSTQIIRNDSIEVLLIRAFGWYLGNVIGILMFTPFVYAVYYLIREKKYAEILSLIPIALIVVLNFLAIYVTNSYWPAWHHVLEDSNAFLIIPFLIAISFQFNLVVISGTVIMISIMTKFLTALDHGPFLVFDNYHYTVLLLQTFLFVIAIAVLIFYAAANERRNNLINLKKAKAKAEESDRLKSSFLANFSHEIRTPMNAVMGFAELLNRPNLSQNKYEEFSQLIQQRSRDLLAIVNDVLDISKIESGQLIFRPSAGNIQQLLDQERNNLEAEVNHLNTKSIEVKVTNELKGVENMVLADFTRLHQVLSNLLSNALKFTERGSIEFGCKLQNTDTLLFYVTDTGVGIDPSQHELIFKPFQQASEDIHQQFGGTGLGLAIVKGLLDLWEGKIWIESEVGKGSSFYFTIPYVQQDKLTIIENAGSEGLNWEDIHILLVEDDIFSASYLKEILNNFPCQLTHVDTGTKALGVARQEKPSIVLMDLGLPDMSGMEVIEQLKKIYPEINVVIITAFATATHKAKAIELGCSAFLTKPLSPATLIKTLTSLAQTIKGINPGNAN